MYIKKLAVACSKKSGIVF